MFISGMVIPILWGTKKQQMVTLSTAEAELVSVCVSVQSGLWLVKLLSDFNIDVGKLIIWEDNQACISLIKNPSNNKRVKHIDIKYRFIQEKIDENKIEIRYIKSEDQIGDMFTKGLSKKIFLRHMKNLTLMSSSNGIN